MQEYATPAIVLDIVDTGESDARVFLFTKAVGRVAARARSLRKIISKLAGHLQPGNIVEVRLVEKKGFQVTDALKVRPVAATSNMRETIAILQMIKQYAQDYHPDQALWDLIERGELYGRPFLTALGFDPEHARCSRCEKIRPSYFIIKDTVYQCRDCLNHGYAG